MSQRYEPPTGYEREYDTESVTDRLERLRRNLLRANHSASTDTHASIDSLSCELAGQSFILYLSATGKRGFVIFSTAGGDLDKECERILRFWQANVEILTE